MAASVGVLLGFLVFLTDGKEDGTLVQVGRQLFVGAVEGVVVRVEVGDCVGVEVGDCVGVEVDFMGDVVTGENE